MSTILSFVSLEYSTVIFLACRFCCTNSKGMTGIKFNTAAGLNQRCNIFKARHDIKPIELMPLLLQYYPYCIRFRSASFRYRRHSPPQMRRRFQNRHYLRIGVAGADALIFASMASLFHICRCKRQIAVALVIVCPVILPAAERAVRRNRCLTARGARTRFLKSLTKVKNCLRSLAVLNVVYLFHALLVAVKIADGIVQNTAVVD